MSTRGHLTDTLLNYLGKQKDGERQKHEKERCVNNLVLHQRSGIWAEKRVCKVRCIGMHASM